MPSHVSCSSSAWLKGNENGRRARKRRVRLHFLPSLHMSPAPLPLGWNGNNSYVSSNQPSNNKVQVRDILNKTDTENHWRLDKTVKVNSDQHCWKLLLTTDWRFWISLIWLALIWRSCCTRACKDNKDFIKTLHPTYNHISNFLSSTFRFKKTVLKFVPLPPETAAIWLLPTGIIIKLTLAVAKAVSTFIWRSMGTESSSRKLVVVPWRREKWIYTEPDVWELFLGSLSNYNDDNFKKQ